MISIFSLNTVPVFPRFLQYIKNQRAPRLASAPYEEDEPGAAREKRRLDKRRNKLRRGEVMEALRDEFGEQPETVRWAFKCNGR